EQSQAQLDQIDKLIQAGSLPENDRLDVVAQIALNEQSLVQGENLVTTSYLRLKQLLELDPSTDFKVLKPEFEVPADSNPEAYSTEEVYATALGTQPQIKANDIRLLSAEKGVNVARSAGLPSLSFFAQMNTNWSSVGKTVNGTSTDFFPITLRTPDGTITTFEVQQESAILIDNPYFDQLNQNFGQGVGLNLQIPIFNGLSTKLNTERAELNVLNTKVTNDLAKQQLKTDVTNAVADARAARKSYEAAERALDASNAAYRNAERRFELGAINTFELTSAKIARDQAEIERTRSKFQYIFNLKIVDFYLGRDLRLD
ncbi:MAG: TolC family protein, partial [Phaeodactylibacter sp.]|nr:TolC family protein [Phaeodactylibacter sp.]